MTRCPSCQAEVGCPCNLRCNGQCCKLCIDKQQSPLQPPPVQNTQLGNNEVEVTVQRRY